MIGDSVARTDCVESLHLQHAHFDLPLSEGNGVSDDGINLFTVRQLKPVRIRIKSNTLSPAVYRDVPLVGRT